MLTYRDTVVSKANHLVGDFVEPQWASDSLKGAVFAGAFVGMILMGYVGDVSGPRLGMMLTLSIVVTCAAATAFAPFVASTWQYLIAFRFFLGVGVGGIYPMSAAIAAASKRRAGADDAADMPALLRASWGFFWQSVGQCIPYLIALFFLTPGLWSSTDPSKLTATQASWLMGLGVVPASAVLALTWYSQTAAQEAADDEDDEAGVSLNAINAQAKAAAGGPLAAMKAHPEYLSTLIGTGGSWCASRCAPRAPPRRGGCRPWGSPLTSSIPPPPSLPQSSTTSPSTASTSSSPRF